MLRVVGSRAIPSVFIPGAPWTPSDRRRAAPRGEAVPEFVASEWLFASVSSRPLGSALGYLAFITFGWLNIYVVDFGAEVPSGLWTPGYSTISW